MTDQSFDTDSPIVIPSTESTLFGRANYPEPIYMPVKPTVRTTDQTLYSRYHRLRARKAQDTYQKRLSEYQDHLEKIKRDPHYAHQVELTVQYNRVGDQWRAIYAEICEIMFRANVISKSTQECGQTLDRLFANYSSFMKIARQWVDTAEQIEDLEKQMVQRRLNTQQTINQLERERGYLMNRLSAQKRKNIEQQLRAFKQIDSDTRQHEDVAYQTSQKQFEKHGEQVVDQLVDIMGWSPQIAKMFVLMLSVERGNFVNLVEEYRRVDSNLRQLQSRLTI